MDKGDFSILRKVRIAGNQFFFDRFMVLKQQLNEIYHEYIHCRDFLMNYVGIPLIRHALTNMKPKISQKLIEIVLNKMAHERRTSGSSAGYYSIPEKLDEITVWLCKNWSRSSMETFEERLNLISHVTV